MSPAVELNCALWVEFLVYRQNILSIKVWTQVCWNMSCKLKIIRVLILRLQEASRPLFWDVAVMYDSIVEEK